ncbi:AAA family ATPase, partial [Acutalibacter muris]|uniref:AAA family ATPase n=1 Tax=Acutalibacter muris TaxID=1796620 RepID=UPI00272E0D79
MGSFFRQAQRGSPVSPDAVSPQFQPLDQLLVELFAAPDGTQPYRFLFADPLRGITDPAGTGDVARLASAAQREADCLVAEAEALNPASDPAARQQPFASNRLVHDSLLVRAALSRRLEFPAETSEAAPASSIACVFNFASRLSSSPEDLTPEENAVFMNLALGAADAIRGDGAHVNTLVLVANRAADIPSWLLRGNPDVRVISLPNPDRPAREAYVDLAFPDLASPALAKARGKLIDTTDAMKLVELDELRRLYARGGTAPENVTELVDLYKYGIRENRWTAMADKLRDDPAAALRRRVKGQEPAIEKIVTVLKRSVMGFSGMQHSSGTKPKGVLFLAGPTGTGKTEIVKAVTELLFGDERSYLRFDMSEYASENADQKLFGAPPGYVGYEAGGQLTNAVRANPFSVLLFDEVEKAHPSI